MMGAAVEPATNDRALCWRCRTPIIYSGALGAWWHEQKPCTLGVPVHEPLPSCTDPRD